MDDLEFIAYCEAHSETPRAGFVPSSIERILRLAGMDDDADEWSEQPPRQIISIEAAAMHPLCAVARKRLAQSGN